MATRRTLRSQRRFLVVAWLLALVALLALPGIASSQCVSSVSRQDMSVRGSVRFIAGTTQDGCNGTRTVSVRAWIENIEVFCYSGQSVQGFCLAQDIPRESGLGVLGRTFTSLVGRTRPGRGLGHVYDSPLRWTAEE
jgi:hypothetical protein